MSQKESGTGSSVDEIALLAGTRGRSFAAAVARELGLELHPVRSDVYPDGERYLQLGAPLGRRNVVILQSTPAPVGESVLELLLLSDAARRSGAERQVAVIPYFGLARQERRRESGQPVGLRVVTEMLRQGGFDRIVTVDLHSPSTEGCFPCPLENLSALPLLAEAVRPHLATPAVVVAPDLGAASLARECGRRLGLPVALVHKTRLNGRVVAVQEVVGEVQGRTPLLVDDMISTGGTIAAAARAVADRGAKSGGMVAATHGIFTPGSGALLRSAGIRRILVTDSVDPVESPAGYLVRLTLAPLLAEAIRRLKEGRSLEDLVSNR
jgi:ribose-phosphate pyrophosphokinase